MKRPVTKISYHLRRLATFASDVSNHSRKLAKVANLRFALLRVQSKRTFKAGLDYRVALPFARNFEEDKPYKRGLHSCESVNAEAVTCSDHAC